MIARLSQAELAGQRVFLRADLNVPLINGAIADDFRLHAILPTLNLLNDKRARIILATHLGRPSGYEKHLSTKPLAVWFQKRGYDVRHIAHDEDAYQHSRRLNDQEIIVLENLRFRPQEQEKSQSYARQLRALADYYVNDAWAACHTADTSLTLLPALFDSNHKSIGLLVEQELEALSPLLEPARPFVIVLGGAKFSKLQHLDAACTRADHVIVLPALSFPVMHTQGTPIGASISTDAYEQEMRHLLSSKEAAKLVLPEDFLVHSPPKHSSLEYTEQLTDSMVGLATGPASFKLYQKIIGQAKSIYFNGLMGFLDRPDTLHPARKLLELIAHQHAYSVIGGGETVAAATRFGLRTAVSFCSTGGGATTAYILNGSLPALDYLL